MVIVLKAGVARLRVEEAIGVGEERAGGCWGEGLFGCRGTAIGEDGSDGDICIEGNGIGNVEEGLNKESGTILVMLCILFGL